MSSKGLWKSAATAATAATGLASKTKQRREKRGVPLNLMVVGQSGTGKSTFVKTLVGKELVPARDYDQFNDLTDRTVDLTAYAEDIEADGQKVILTVIDTPGFGDNINNSKGFIKILEYVENQHKRFLAEESRVQRNAKFQDTRVHVILYFIPATGHSLRDIDVVFMKQLGRRANILPVIAKADSLLPAEMKEFKKRIMEDIQKFEIPIFDFPVNSEDDDDIVQENKEFRAHLPFSIIGSGQLFESGGQMVAARKYPWGVAVVENEQHCDYMALKVALLSSHLEVVKEITNDLHYENYRQESLTKGLDSTKIEDELNLLEKREKEEKDKERADRDRRVAMKQEMKKSSSEKPVYKSDPRHDDDRMSTASDEGKKKDKERKPSEKKSKKSEGGDEEKEKKKKKKKEKSEGGAEEKDDDDEE